MTLEETGEIMDVLTIAYPQYYKNVSEDDKFKASCLWAEMFIDDPTELVIAAVKSFVATDTKGFPPSIGIIKNHIFKVSHGGQKSALEAWGEVKAAVRNSAYSSKQEFEKLDPVARRIVGSPAQLREWALSDANSIDSVIGSNFQKSYLATAESHREYLAAPSAVKQFMRQNQEHGLKPIGDMLKLDEGHCNGKI